MTQTLLDDATADTLRAILAAPALPVGTTAAGPGGERIAVLREALDYVGSRRLVADETRPAESLAALAGVDAGLAGALAWHAPLTALLASLPAEPARNAVLGGVRRGGLLTWATSVRSWQWEGGQWPTRTEPIRRASAEFEIDEFPGLYDTVLAWEPGAGALIAIPTHRDRLAWAQADTETGRAWTVRLTKAVFHEQELIPLEYFPADLSQSTPYRKHISLLLLPAVIIRKEISIAMRVSTRLKLLTAAILAGSLISAGCSASANTSSATADSSTPHSGGNIIFLEDGDWGGFDQPDLRLWQTSSIATNLFETLTWLDPTTGKIVPWLASSWTVNKAYTVYTLNIHKGVTFSNGTPLTAQVVKNNLDRFGNGDSALGYAPNDPDFKSYGHTVVTGPLQVTVYLKSPDTGFLDNLADLDNAIVAQSTLNLSKVNAANPANAIGTGPFVFKSQIPNKQLVIVRRAGYDWPPATATHTGEAYLNSVTYIVTTEGAERTGLLESGQAQAARDILLSDEKTLQSKGFQYYGSRPYGTVRELDINPSASPLAADISIRKAIEYGINRQQLVDTLYNDNWAVATSLLQPGTPGYTNTTSLFPYDPAKAEQLLNADGWNKFNSQGIRVKDGQTLTLTFYPELQWVDPIPDAELIANQLKQIGIQLNLVQLDRNTYNVQMTKPTNVFSTNHLTDLDVEDLWSDYLTGGAYGVSNAGFDKILAEIRATPVGSARTALVTQAQTFLLDNAYIIPLEDDQQSFMTSPHLHGFQNTALGRAYLYDAWLDN
jgi:peptide/nickel transport system substrate-binding protein